MKYILFSVSIFFFAFPISLNAIESSEPGIILKKKTESVISDLKITGYTNNSYRYNTSKGILITDCSWFMKIIMKDLFPGHYRELPKSSKDVKTALAKDYFSFFEMLSSGKVKSIRWKAITKPEDLKPGDIIVYKHKDNSETTGHVMILISKQKNPPNRDFYILEIADSARSPHSEDTREKGVYKAFKKSGAGIGKMVFFRSRKNNNKGIFTAYGWKMSSKKIYKCIIRAGRLIKP